MQLHRHLRHLELNVVVVFPKLNDRQNYLTDNFQYRRGLADDALPVSSLLLSLNRAI
jgi:hypothetical protein